MIGGTRIIFDYYNGVGFKLTDRTLADKEPVYMAWFHVQYTSHTVGMR